MDLLTSLTNLTKNVAYITLPGVIAAIAIAMLLWPPQTGDRIPCVTDNHPDIRQRELDGKTLLPPSKQKVDEYIGKSREACEIKEGVASPLFLINPTLSGRNNAAVENQLTLDDTNRILQKCVEEETALMNVEDQIVSLITTQVTTRSSDLQVYDKAYQGYEATLGPLAGTLKTKRDAAEAEIAGLQAFAMNFQLMKAERTRRVAQYNRLATEMAARLGDAGRLRPKQKFDDVLTGIGNHIAGFLTLVIACGLLIDPINRAAFGMFYDNSFDDQWDLVRPDRMSVGQQVRNRLIHPPQWTGWRAYRSEKLPSLVIVSVLLVVAILLALEFVIAGQTTQAGTQIACTTGACANGTYATSNPDLFFSSSHPLTLLLQCFVMAVIALLISFFLPSVLKAASPGRVISPEIDEPCQDPGDTPPPYKIPVSGVTAHPAPTGHAQARTKQPEPKQRLNCCEQKLARDWHRVSQPAYAIGTSLLARADYKALRDEYYSQSVASSSLILPVLVLTFAIFMSPQFGKPFWGGYLFLVVVEIALFLTAVDRRHKFLTEYENMISANYLAKCKAAQTPAKPANLSPSVATQIADALTNAKIVEIEDTKFHIVPASASAAVSVAPVKQPTSQTNVATNPTGTSADTDEASQDG